jgi:hypothetical protein
MSTPFTLVLGRPPVKPAPKRQPGELNCHATNLYYVSPSYNTPTTARSEPPSARAATAKRTLTIGVCTTRMPPYEEPVRRDQGGRLGACQDGSPERDPGLCRLVWSWGGFACIQVTDTSRNDLTSQTPCIPDSGFRDGGVGDSLGVEHIPGDVLRCAGRGLPPR